MRAHDVATAMLCAITLGCRGSVGVCAPVDPLDPPYSAYQFLSSNFATSPEQAVYIDIESFTGSTLGAALTAADFTTASTGIMDLAESHWNGASKAKLEIREGVACTEASSTGVGDRECANDGEWNDVYLALDGDDLGAPAYRDATLGKDENGGCLAAADLLFFPEYRECLTDETDLWGLCKKEDWGPTVSIHWVAFNTGVSDTDDSDGTRDRPLYDTLVHELGHLLGLGHPPENDASVACTVMSGCAGANPSSPLYDPSCACDFLTISELDRLALQRVYGK